MNFNPTLVQLESKAGRGKAEIQNVFQSHIGAIRMCSVPLRVNSRTNFNPTLVQLELQVRVPANSTLKRFQSHIGAIRIT